MTAAPEHRESMNATFETLYAEHHRVVLAYCARRTSSDEAWDAAADVFLVAYRRLDDVPSGDGTLPWLLAVARRVLSNQRRGDQRRRRLILRASGHRDAEGAFIPETLLVRREDEVEVVEALSRLRPIDREIITLALWEELRPVEIAATLGISRASVDKRVERAKRRLGAEFRRQQRRHATQPPSEKGGPV